MARGGLRDRDEEVARGHRGERRAHERFDRPCGKPRIVDLGQRAEVREARGRARRDDRGDLLAARVGRVRLEDRDELRDHRRASLLPRRDERIAGGRVIARAQGRQCLLRVCHPRSSCHGYPPGMPHRLTSATIETEAELRACLGEPQPVVLSKIFCAIHGESFDGDAYDRARAERYAKREGFY